MTGTSTSREVVGGVDTHGKSHHAAVLDAWTGKLLSDASFPATSAGYRQLLRWFGSHGQVQKVGVEGTGSYGAGLFCYLDNHNVLVIEVARPNRQHRRLQGKSDPLDAIAAARSVLAETATVIPKPRQGAVEAIRLIRATRRSAVKARQAALAQIHSLLVSAPDTLRSALADYDRAALVARCARLRLTRTAAPADPAVTAKTMLRRLARRIQTLDIEIAEANTELEAIISTTAPSLLAIVGVGTETAGQLLTTAGENPHRLRNEAALARLCGTAPIPASSGNTTRHRLHRGGDRHANSALHMIIINRLRWHEPTKAYLQRRTTEGKTKKEIIRCLKRAIIREIYTALKTDLQQPAHTT